MQMQQRQDPQRAPPQAAVRKTSYRKSTVAAVLMKSPHHSSASESSIAAPPPSSSNVAALMSMMSLSEKEKQQQQQQPPPPTSIAALMSMSVSVSNEKEQQQKQPPPPPSSTNVATLMSMMSLSNEKKEQQQQQKPVEYRQEEIDMICQQICDSRNRKLLTDFQNFQTTTTTTNKNTNISSSPSPSSSLANDTSNTKNQQRTDDKTDNTNATHHIKSSNDSGLTPPLSHTNSNSSNIPRGGVFDNFSFSPAPPPPPAPPLPAAGNGNANLSNKTTAATAVVPRVNPEQPESAMAAVAEVSSSSYSAGAPASPSPSSSSSQTFVVAAAAVGRRDATTSDEGRRKEEEENHEQPPKVSSSAVEPVPPTTAAAPAAAAHLPLFSNVMASPKRALAALFGGGGGGGSSTPDNRQNITNTTHIGADGRGEEMMEEDEGVGLQRMHSIESNSGVTPVNSFRKIPQNPSFTMAYGLRGPAAAAAAAGASRVGTNDLRVGSDPLHTNNHNPVITVVPPPAATALAIATASPSSIGASSSSPGAGLVLSPLGALQNSNSQSVQSPMTQYSLEQQQHSSINGERGGPPPPSSPFSSSSLDSLMNMDRSVTEGHIHHHSPDFDLVNNRSMLINSLLSHQLRESSHRRRSPEQLEERERQQQQEHENLQQQQQTWPPKFEAPWFGEFKPYPPSASAFCHQAVVTSPSSSPSSSLSPSSLQQQQQQQQRQRERAESVIRHAQAKQDLERGQVFRVFVATRAESGFQNLTNVLRDGSSKSVELRTPCGDAWYPAPIELRQFELSSDNTTALKQLRLQKRVWKERLLTLQCGGNVYMNMNSNSKNSSETSHEGDDISAVDPLTGCPLWLLRLAKIKCELHGSDGNVKQRCTQKSDGMLILGHTGSGNDNGTTTTSSPSGVAAATNNGSRSARQHHHRMGEVQEPQLIREYMNCNFTPPPPTATPRAPSSNSTFHLTSGTSPSPTPHYPLASFPQSPSQQNLLTPNSNTDFRLNISMSRDSGGNGNNSDSRARTPTQPNSNSNSNFNSNSKKNKKQSGGGFGEDFTLSCKASWDGQGTATKQITCRVVLSWRLAPGYSLVCACATDAGTEQLYYECMKVYHAHITQRAVLYALQHQPQQHQHRRTLFPPSSSENYYYGNRNNSRQQHTFTGLMTIDFGTNALVTRTSSSIINSKKYSPNSQEQEEDEEEERQYNTWRKRFVRFYQTYDISKVLEVDQILAVVANNANTTTKNVTFNVNNASSPSQSPSSPSGACASDPSNNNVNNNKLNHNNNNNNNSREQRYQNLLRMMVQKYGPEPAARSGMSSLPIVFRGTWRLNPNYSTKREDNNVINNNSKHQHQPPGAAAAAAGIAGGCSSGIGGAGGPSIEFTAHMCDTMNCAEQNGTLKFLQKKYPWLGGNIDEYLANKSLRLHLALDGYNMALAPSPPSPPSALSSQTSSSTSTASASGNLGPFSGLVHDGQGIMRVVMLSPPCAEGGHSAEGQPQQSLRHALAEACTSLCSLRATTTT